jgi:hypothetical protein
MERGYRTRNTRTGRKTGDRVEKRGGGGMEVGRNRKRGCETIDRGRDDIELQIVMKRNCWYFFLKISLPIYMNYWYPVPVPVLSISFCSKTCEIEIIQMFGL